MTPTIMPVELVGVACRFGRKAVLRSVDLRIGAGECVVLLGANGAGKTTLFSLLAGLLQPDEGERRFAGREVDEVDLELRARMVYVAHAPQLYPLLSAIENLELFARLRGAAGSPATIAAALARLGLGVDAHTVAVATLSRGMAQRVVLARALLAQPELLLLDEPFTALDRSGRRTLVEVLAGERARGAAILVSSHDLEITVEIADRVLLLEEGRIVGEATRRDGELEAFRRRILALGGATELRAGEEAEVLSGDASC